jgi:hypothetical protein
MGIQAAVIIFIKILEGLWWILKTYVTVFGYFFIYIALPLYLAGILFGGSFKILVILIIVISVLSIVYLLSKYSTDTVFNKIKNVFKK